jgi:hypothetical protein
MKPLHAIIGIVGILFLVSAPVVANAAIPSWLLEPPFVVDPPIPIGTLSINSDPSGANVYLEDQYGHHPLTTRANVYLYGQYQGTTPLTISLPAPQWYNIGLTMPGYRKYATRVYISEGKTSTVSATLIPIQILPSGYMSSNSMYLPTSTAPFYGGPRSAVDVYFWFKTLGNLPVI